MTNLSCRNKSGYTIYHSQSCSKYWYNSQLLAVYQLCFHRLLTVTFNGLRRQNAKSFTYFCQQQARV